MDTVALTAPCLFSYATALLWITFPLTLTSFSLLSTPKHDTHHRLSHTQISPRGSECTMDVRELRERGRFCLRDADAVVDVQLARRGPTRSWGNDDLEPFRVQLGDGVGGGGAQGEDGAATDVEGDTGVGTLVRCALLSLPWTGA